MYPFPKAPRQMPNSGICTDNGICKEFDSKDYAIKRHLLKFILLLCVYILIITPLFFNISTNTIIFIYTLFRPWRKHMLHIKYHISCLLTNVLWFRKCIMFIKMWCIFLLFFNFLGHLSKAPGKHLLVKVSAKDIKYFLSIFHILLYVDSQFQESYGHSSV